jgi:hypothetical protein
MRVMLLISALIFSILLFGCAASTGVIPAGPDTYTITTDSTVGVGVGVGTIKIRAIQDAKAYCASSGKKMKTVRPPRLSSRKNFVGNDIPTYNLTFRCLATGDED